MKQRVLQKKSKGNMWICNDFQEALNIEKSSKALLCVPFRVLIIYSKSGRSHHHEYRMIKNEGNELQTNMQKYGTRLSYKWYSRS